MSTSSTAVTTAVTSIPSEDVIARKVSVTFGSPTSRPTRSGQGRVKAYGQFDNCVADLLVNSGIGFGVGVVASVLLFRRRAWPVALTTGFGAGVAYTNCNYSLNPYVLPGTKILPASQQ